MVEPDRHFGVVAAGRRGVAVVAAHLVGQHLAIGQLAGEQLVERDAEREQVALGVGQFGFAFGGVAVGGLAVVAPLLGVDVARRAGVQAALGVALNLNSQLGQTRTELTAQLQAVQAELAAMPRADYVAVLNDNQASAAVLVTFDPVRRQLHLQRVGSFQEADDRSLQLWALPPGSGPRSLGVLTRERLLQLATDPAVVNGVPTLAISLEPRGGVPEAGGPTGPVLFKGALIQRQN